MNCNTNKKVQQIEYWFVLLTNMIQDNIVIASDLFVASGRSFGSGSGLLQVYLLESGPKLSQKFKEGELKFVLESLFQTGLRIPFFSRRWIWFLLAGRIRFWLPPSRICNPGSRVGQSPLRSGTLVPD